MRYSARRASPWPRAGRDARRGRAAVGPCAACSPPPRAAHKGLLRARVARRKLLAPGGVMGLVTARPLPRAYVRPAYSAARRSRSALAMTDTLDRLIAALASMGLSRSPKKG